MLDQDVLRKTGTPESVIKILTDVDTKRAAVLIDLGLTEAAKRKAVSDIVLAGRAAVEQERDSLRKAANREVDQEEGTIRAKARDELTLSSVETSSDLMTRLLRETHRQRRSVETQIDVTLLLENDDLAELQAAVEDAEIAGDPFRFSRIAQAAQRRLTRLAAVERRKGGYLGTGPAQLALGLLEAKLTQWRKVHPSPAARLRELDRARFQRTLILDTAINSALGLAKLDGVGVGGQVKAAAIRAGRQLA